MSNYISPNCKCPYFKVSGANKMTCEGAIDSTKTTTIFSRSEYKQEWFEKVCCDNWEICPVAEMVKKKYDR